MRFYMVLFLTHFFVICNTYRIRPSFLVRSKRDTSGALRIVNNHEQPIHEDIKFEGFPVSEKPCKHEHIPSPIEMGTVFQVTPPKPAWFEGKSLRKSSPLTSKLDLIRSVSRAVTLSVLLLSGIVEFYPVIQHLYYTIYNFMYL